MPNYNVKISVEKDGEEITMGRATNAANESHLDLINRETLLDYLERAVISFVLPAFLAYGPETASNITATFKTIKSIIKSVPRYVDGIPEFPDTLKNMTKTFDENKPNIDEEDVLDTMLKDDRISDYFKDIIKKLKEKRQ